jgi:phosphatidate cytidylyltransferase
MRKLVERLLLFFVGLPAIIASVFFLPYCNYIILHIELLAFSVLAILEMRDLLSKRLPVHSAPLSILLGMIIPVAAFLYAVPGLPVRIITASIAVATILVFFIEFILSFSGKFDSIIGRIASTFIFILYPGYLVMYLAIMTVWPHAGAILSVFFLMVFGCDSLAWFFGMLFGNSNRGMIKASPNKSIAGFAGGYIGAIGAGIAGTYIFTVPFSGSIVQMIILGGATATAAIVGDIFESILKRCANIKDSGNIIPGRGGVLDSIDSILLSAPVYYILCDLLFGFGK